MFLAPTQTKRRSKGFTLIELLTVIAIIGVLATLVLTAATSAKKKSREAYCTGNLHQIALAMTMYLDDNDKRPPDLDALVTTRNLANPKALLCPADKTKNWGRLAANSSFTFQAVFIPAPGMTVAEPVPYSYLHPLKWDDDSWKRLMEEGFKAGFSSCELHGIGKQNPDAPSYRDFQGLLLRGQRDGAVVRRHLFWADNSPPPLPTGDSTTSSAMTMNRPMNAGSDLPWDLFADPAPPNNGQP